MLGLARLISIQDRISDYSVAMVGRGVVKVWTLRLSGVANEVDPDASHRPSGSTSLRSAQDDMGAKTFSCGEGGPRSGG